MLFKNDNMARVLLILKGCYEKKVMFSRLSLLLHPKNDLYKICSIDNRIIDFYVEVNILPRNVNTAVNLIIS